ncbi:hypothetical protein ABK040_014658 [Willaertia magna]
MKNNENQQQQQNNNEINNLMIPLCNVCIEDEWEQQSICFCKDCSKYLCEIHTGIHKKKLKSHILEYLSPTTTIITTETTTPIIQQQIIISSSNNNNNTLQQQSQLNYPSHYYCKEHQDQITNIKCKNCKLLICIKCALQQHKKHDNILLQDCIKKDKNKVLNLLNEAKNFTTNIKKRKLNIENEITKINKQIKISNENIELEFNEINKILNDKKKQLLNEINNLQKSEIEKLEKENFLLEENLQQLNELCQINDLNNLNDIDLEINKFKFENNNELYLQNNLQKLQNLNFTINTDQIISTINKINKEFNLIGFSNNFNFITQFGSKGSEKNQFIYPRDILIDNNLIYIVDKDNYRISIFTLENIFIKQIKFNFKPSCIKLDKTNDTLLIGDYNDCLIYRYSKNGKFLKNYSFSDKNNIVNEIIVSDIEVDELTGNIYILLDENFNFVKSFGKEGSNQNEFYYPTNITIDYKTGFLYVVDCNNNCIKIYK